MLFRENSQLETFGFAMLHDDAHYHIILYSIFFGITFFNLFQMSEAASSKNDRLKIISDAIGTFPDFPKKGIRFRFVKLRSLHS